MVEEKTSIIYLAHGPKHLHKQAILSILTLFYHVDDILNNYEIIIYTDDTQIFEKYLGSTKVAYEVLSRDWIQRSIKNDYVHRIKICVIQHCMKKYGANVMFVDGDTYFLKSPLPLLQQISATTTVFHNFEYTIADGGDSHEEKNWLVLRKLAKRYTYTLQGKTFTLDINTPTWNSGVLGISKEHYAALDDVLDFNDQLTSKMYFKTAEQFAFTYVLSSYTSFVPAEEFVYHYWQQEAKLIYNFHIDKLLKKIENLPLPEKAAEAVQLTLRHKELKLPKQTLLQRVKVRAELILKVARTGHL